MSGTSQAPGWWQASDGQWYPPQDESEMHDFDDDNGPVAAHRHPNGGGWVADTASVAKTAFVGPDASVFQFASVGDFAAVTDTAWVLGSATVSGHARVAGDAEVNGNARVEEDAEVAGNAFVTDFAVVGGHAVVGDDAKCREACRVTGDARVLGNAVISGDVEVTGANRVQAEESGAAVPIAHASVASAHTPETSTQVASTPVRTDVTSWVVIGAGVVLALGSLLPWATVSAIVTVSKNGTSGDGVATLIAGGLAVILGAFLLRGNVYIAWRMGGLFLFLVSFAVCVYDASNLPTGNQYASVSVGIGLWLCIVASLVGVGGTGVKVFAQH